ncbi:MAG: hypothetical protein ABJA78_01970 [Ferruginibacter sp.]
MAQVKKPKAKPDIPQMPDMEKMLKELPADQRAMAKEMLKNTTGAMSNKEEAVTKSPSPIVKIYLKQPLQIPTQGQAKNHLLWYKGKKINDSMLVTTKAMVVLYSRKRNMVIAEPLEKTDSFRIMVKNVSKQAKMTEDYVNTEFEKKNSFMNYPLVQMTVDKFEEIDDLFNNAMKNTIDLPPLPSGTPVSGKVKGGGMNFDADFTPEQDLAALHNRLKQLLQNEPDMNFDAPPKENFSLANRCDENVQKRYIEELKKWEDNFHDYEYNLLRAAMAAERWRQLAEMDGIKIEYDMAALTADIQKAIDRSDSRQHEKIKQLINRYGKNIFMQSCVIVTALGYERQKQLLGQGEDGPSLAMDAIKLLEGPEFENYINEQIQQKNWDVVLNISFMLGRVRTAQLLGLSDALVGRLSQLTNRLMKMNRFALTVDIDFNLQYSSDDGKVDLKANATIQTTDKVYVCLAPTGCKWTLSQTEVDYKDGKKASYIPMQVTGGIKSVKDAKGQWQQFSYSGSKDMLMYFPVFRIDFSNSNGQDTATLQELKYVSLDDHSVSESYTTDLLGYLNDVFVVPSKTGANEKAAEDMGKEMMSKFSVLTTMPNSGTTLGKLKDRYLLMQQKQEAEKGIADIVNTSKAVILFSAQNNSSTIVDDKIDTRHKNQNVEVIKGVIKIKVVHDPVL